MATLKTPASSPNTSTIPSVPNLRPDPLVHSRIVNGFIPEYPGYGHLPGTPTESAVYTAARQAYNYLTKELDIDPMNIVVYGRSLGSAPAIHIASGGGMRGPPQIRGLVLQSPILSVYRAGHPNLSTLLIGDMFVNIDKIGLVQTPTLIIHGVDDDLVPFEHGRQLYEKSTWAVPPLFIKGAGHNNLESHYGEILNRTVREFVVEGALALYEKKNFEAMEEHASSKLVKMRGKGVKGNKNIEADLDEVNNQQDAHLQVELIVSGSRSAHKTTRSFWSGMFACTGSRQKRVDFQIPKEESEEETSPSNKSDKKPKKVKNGKCYRKWTPRNPEEPKGVISEVLLV
ncbi:hypothetical protein AAMO2058_001054800 [Amorphochlora amoebiformis]